MKKRAAELMDTQRKVQRERTANCLEGILPPELDLSSPNVGELATAAVQEPDGKANGGGLGEGEETNVFKRPLEESAAGGTTCKRVKMN